MDIGKKLKRLRIKHQLTLEELANRSELSKGFLSQLENNNCSPSISTLEDILEVLGSSLQDFFADTSEETIVLSEKDYFENTQPATFFACRGRRPVAADNSLRTLGGCRTSFGSLDRKRSVIQINCSLIDN